jgi:hypothetical protein
MLIQWSPSSFVSFRRAVHECLHDLMCFIQLRQRNEKMKNKEKSMGASQSPVVRRQTKNHSAESKFASACRALPIRETTPESHQRDSSEREAELAARAWPHFRGTWFAPCVLALCAASACMASPCSSNRSFGSPSGQPIVLVLGHQLVEVYDRTFSN